MEKGLIIGFLMDQKLHKPTTEKQLKMLFLLWAVGEDVLYDGVEGGDGVAGEEELLEAGVGGEAGARAAEAVVAQPELGQLGTRGQQPPHTRPAHTVTVQDQLRQGVVIEGHYAFKYFRNELVKK